RADLFAFGSVLYEMATGRPAFCGRTLAVVFDEILNKAPAPARESNPALPEELEHIIAKALEKDRDVRYQTASDLRAALKRLKRDTESGRIIAVAVRHASSDSRARSQWPLASVAAGILLAAALLLAILAFSSLGRNGRGSSYSSPNSEPELPALTGAPRVT